MRVIILSLILLLSLLNGASAITSSEQVKRYLDLLNNGNKSERELALDDLPWLLESSGNRKDDKVFDQILKALKGKDPLIREAAAASLEKLGKYTKGCCKETKIIPSLIEALSDKEPGVRREAAAALAYYQDKHALSPLIESLKDQDPWVRLNAAFALGELGDMEAIQPLLELLNNNTDWRNKYVQQECLIAIRKIASNLPYFHKQREVVPVLSEKFDDEYLKAEIIKILKDGKLCTPYITDELIRASQNPRADEKLRQKFSEEMKWPDFCASQFKEKIIMATQDPNEEIRRLALEALEKPIFGGTRKIEQQGQVITVEHAVLAASLKAAKDPSTEVRVKAIESLGRLCPPSDSANPATEAVRGKIIETLVDALHDGNTKVKEEAISALGRIGDKRAIRPLIEVLHDSNADSQKKAAEALGKFKDEKILDELIPLLSSKEYNLREAAKATFFTIAEKSCQEQVYVYRHGGVRYCVKSRKEIPEPVRIDKDSIRLVHPNAVTMLINGLKNPDPDIRMGILSVIWKFEDARIKQTLTKLLDDPSPDVRLKAYALLRDLGAESGIDIVIACLADKDKNVKIKAAVTLGELRDERALQPLLKALNDPDEDVRIAVAQALGKSQDKRAIEPLIQRLQDENYKVKRAVLDSLANFDDPRILDANLKMLQDESLYVRGTAARKISQKPDARAVQPLILLLNDPDSSVRPIAAEALGKIGDKKAVEPLLNVLKGGFNKNRGLGGDVHLRQKAALALGEIGDQRAVPALIDALNDDQLRFAAIRSLGAIKDKQAIPTLLQVAGKHPGDRRDVKQALEAYKNPEMVDVLIGYLDDKDNDIKKGAILVLGEFHDPRAIESLQRFTNDPDPQLKDAAKNTIRKIQTEPYTPKSVAVLPAKVKDSRGRIEVAQQRGKIQEHQALLPLVEKLKDPDESVRRAAFNSLANFDDPRIVELVTPLLGDSNRSVACDAAKLLGKSGDKRAVDPLTKVLQGRYDRQNDFRDRLLKEAAIWALAEIRDERAADVLIAVVQGKFSHTSPTDRNMIQTAAILALGEMGDTRAVPALIEALNDIHLKKYAISSLGELKDNRAIPALLRVVGSLPHGSIYVPDVKEALEAYKNPEMVDVLIGYLDDKDNDIKKGAILVLGEFREQKAIEPLQRLKNDPDPQIRDSAKNVLLKIKAPEATLIVSQPTPGYPQTGVSTPTQPQTAPPVASDAKKIKLMIDKLKNKDPKIKSEAADSLGDNGNKEAVPHLIPLLKDENAYVRQAAARALGKLKATDAVVPLIDCLNDLDLYVLAWTIWALGEIRDPKAIDALTPFLYHKEEKLRDNSFEALRKFEGQDARRKMVNILIDHAKSSYWPAESMLSKLISLEGDDVILQAVKDPEGNEAQTVKNYIKLMEANVRNVSDIAKKGLKEHKDRELLISELSSFIRRVDRPRDPININEKIQVQRLSDANDSIRFIGELKDPRGLPILMDILKNRNTFSKSAVRTAIDSLGDWGHAEAANLFLAILADTNEDVGCRRSAARALGKFGSEKAVKTLIDIVKNENEKIELRIAAASSLGDIRDKRAVEPLITVLKNSREDLWLRIASASALGNIGDKRAIGPLQEALKDHAVKNAAQSALSKMKSSQ